MFAHRHQQLSLRPADRAANVMTAREVAQLRAMPMIVQTQDILQVSTHDYITRPRLGTHAPTCGRRIDQLELEQDVKMSGCDIPSRRADMTTNKSEVGSRHAWIQAG